MHGRRLAPLRPLPGHGVRSPLVVHRPRPFQPAFGSSILPSKPLAEAQRVRHLQGDHAAVLERDQAIRQVGGGHGHVLAKSEGVVLVDPRVVARLGAVFADASKARTGVPVERPALRTVVASRLGSVERSLHLRRSKLARCPLDSDAQTTPLRSISAPRIPNPGSGTW